eukprot:65310-Karenia_brevis.AAC.1
MNCFGNRLFLRGLWKDVGGQEAEIHIRTDANNLITTAQTTHLPEQKETIQTNMLRAEFDSGAMDDSAHVDSANCLGDPLTKTDILIKA